MGKPKIDEKNMHIVGHLSELRKRLIITAIFFFIFFIIGFLYIEEIYQFLVKNLEFNLTAISPTEILWIYFSIAGIVAFACTIPFLTYQIWAFVKPGLTNHERKVTLSYIPAVFILFVVGVIFAYILFTKLLIPFILSLNNGMFEIMFTVDKYFSFMLYVIFPIAILFEMPVIIMFLTSIGIITHEFLIKKRKYAYFILIVISTLITPADFFLPIIVSIPLILIYEISVNLSKRVYQKKLAKHEKFLSEEIS